MVNYERKYVEVMLAGWLGFHMKSLDEAITYLQGLKAQYGDNCTINEYNDSYDSKYLGLFQEIPETDAQMKVRISQEEDLEKRRYKQERLQYEELKKKYGKISAL
jgi:hypothetical protein